MKKTLSFDSIRFLTSLFIVAIHIYPFTSISALLDYSFTRVLFRVCVPLFLMISGYFVLPKAKLNVRNLKLYSWKIFRLYCVSSFLYVPILWYQKKFLSLSFWNFFSLVFFQGTFYHLWYFPALLLGIWITFFLMSKCTLRNTLLISFVLYLVGVGGDSYYGFLSSIPFLSSFYSFFFSLFGYTRNGIFYVPLFLILGYIVRVQNHEIKSFWMIFFFFLLFVEGMTLYFLNIPRHTSMYLSLPFFSYFLMSFFSIHLHGESKRLRDLSTFVYVMHPLFFVLVHRGLKFFSDHIIFTHSLIVYFLVILITIGSFYFMTLCKEVFIHGCRHSKKSCLD